MLLKKTSYVYERLLEVLKLVGTNITGIKKRKKINLYETIWQSIIMFD